MSAGCSIRRWPRCGRTGSGWRPPAAGCRPPVREPPSALPLSPRADAPVPDRTDKQSAQNPTRLFSASFLKSLKLPDNVMSSSAEPTPDQTATARLTAWALDELPAPERPSFEAGLAQNPELRAEAEATRDFCQILESRLRPDENHALRLSPEIRQALEDRAQAARKSPVRRLSFWMPTLAAAACIAVMSGVVIHSHQKKTARLNGSQDVAVQEDVRTLLRRGFGYYDLGQFSKAEEEFKQALSMDPGNTVAENALQRSKQEVSNYLRAARDHTRLKMLNDVDRLWETSVPGTSRVPSQPSTSEGMAIEALADADADGYNNQQEFRSASDTGYGPSYSGLPENKFLSPVERPLSTFSIDVDTASYAIVRRHLNDGALPLPAAVRLEELINYFPMDDAPPPSADGRPFAVHAETASAPWAAGHRLVRVALKGK
ncbi:MAG: tetratricopeptide repeat protein, partial [Verrucomicrobiaceae bacterium]